LPQAKGKVYLVGAGPGSPDLLTVRAARVLQRADVVLYDRLVSTEILLLARSGAELVSCGKRQGEQERIQKQINAKMLRYARLGKTVVRLKSGDPMVFSRGGEEWAHLLEQGIAVEVVPGVSSALAAPALAGIPLTYRGVAGAFAIVTGHRCNQDPQSWAAYAGVDTLVVLMGVENRASIAAHLIAAGRSPQQPVAFVQSASTLREKVIVSTLAETAAGLVHAAAPAIFVIGDVVRVREELLALVTEEDVVEAATA
jgi:uroporphyrin-III C-methyltransferase